MIITTLSYTRSGGDLKYHVCFCVSLLLFPGFGWVERFDYVPISETSFIVLHILSLDSLVVLLYRFFLYVLCYNFSLLPTKDRTNCFFVRSITAPIQPCKVMGINYTRLD